MKTWLCALFVFAFAFSLSAQTKMYEKLKDLKDKPEKVSIIVDGKQLDFEGKEAEQLLKKLKMVSKLAMSKNDDFVFLSEDEDDDEIEIQIITGDSDDEYLVWVTEDMINDSSATVEEIDIKEENGAKEVTITITTDGEKTTKILTGEEADKYLSEMKEMEGIICCDEDEPHKLIKMDSDKLMSMRKRIIKSRKESEKNNCEKQIIKVKKIKKDEEEK